jgi:hypothetical protein
MVLADDKRIQLNYATQAEKTNYFCKSSRSI